MKIPGRTEAVAQLESIAQCIERPSLPVPLPHRYLPTPLPAFPRLWSTHCDGEVLLRLSKHGPGHETPMTIPELFQESVERFGAYPALASKNGKKWDTLTFSQYYEVCRKVARSLMKVSSSSPT